MVKYLTGYLDRLGSNSLSDADLLNLLGGDGGAHVDAVFYVISGRKLNISWSLWKNRLTNPRLQISSR